MKWTCDTGKPYIRRANGKEMASSIRDAYRLAYCQLTYGTRGFYVLIQRKTGREILDCAKTSSELKRRIIMCHFVRFQAWANSVKRRAQGKKRKFCDNPHSEYNQNERRRRGQKQDIDRRKRRELKQVKP